jgi:hypothetical protein
MDDKLTFEEWIGDFKERYTPEQVEIFKACWEHTVNTRKLTEKLGNKLETERWYIDWINSVAWKLGK